MNAHDLRVEEQVAPYLVAPVLTDYLDTFASAPEGFKRLRELVLNLAVRGRLVPQDAKEEPATALAECIKARRARLVSVGTCKREKPFPTIAEDEPPYGLPHGWQWIRLGQLLSKIGAGSTPLGGKEVYVSNGVKFLRSQNVWNDGLRLTDTAYIKPETHQRMSGTRVLPHDLLFNITGASIGRCAVVPEAIGEANVSQHVTIVRPVLAQTTPYLHLVLISSHVQQTVMDVQVGVSREGLSIGKLGNFLVPLPPLAEQSRIVAKVEELMALIDRLEARVSHGETARGKLLDALFTALADSPDAATTADAWAQLAPHFDLLLQTPADVDRLQQTLLQLAIKGRLVPQDPKDEPAAQLLKRIRAEKERLFGEGKIKRDKPLPAIGEDEKPYDLPDGWQWARVPAIADTRLGKMLDKAKNRGHLRPYLRNTNVQWFRFDLSDVKELRLEDVELNELRVLPGDLLICEGGEPGRCAIWKDAAREIYFQKALHRVRTYCGVLPEFIQLCLRVDCVTGRLDEFFTGATIKHFPGQALDEYCVPLPPLPEQSRIVAAVASLTVLSDRLRERLAARRALSAKLAAALTESALA